MKSSPRVRNDRCRPRRLRRRTTGGMSHVRGRRHACQASRSPQRDGGRARPPRFGGVGRTRRGLAGVGPVDRLVRRTVTPEELEATNGQRLRGALTELGTTYIKFGQMLSLRPDLVGEDIANELATLQATVPADPPGVAQRTVEAQLGAAVVRAVRHLRVRAVRVRIGGAGAPGHAEGRHRGGREGAARRRRHQGPRGHRPHAGRRRLSGDEDPEIAQLRPTILVDEFAAMMDGCHRSPGGAVQPPTVPPELRW